jgi:hypothetical protein
MKTRFMLVLKAVRRFCSHYNLVGMLVLYVFAFIFDLMSSRPARSRARVKDMSSRLYSKSERDLRY